MREFVVAELKAVFDRMTAGLRCWVPFSLKEVPANSRHTRCHVQVHLRCHDILRSFTMYRITLKSPNKEDDGLIFGEYLLDHL